MPPVLGTLEALENETTGISYVMMDALVPSTPVIVMAVNRAAPLAAVGLRHVTRVTVDHDDDMQTLPSANSSVGVVSVIPKLVPSCETYAPPDPGPFGGAV